MLEMCALTVFLDADDLAEAIALAVECDLPGHEVMYIASPDTIGGRDLSEAWRAAYPDAGTELRPRARPDSSAVSTAKAQLLLGWRPKRSWRDCLTSDGQSL
ncbi:MAG: UDP-glucose 4-epimerase [Mycobacterium sp.]|nr:UDP-glucose 4-epimerase [Mycobacterium sp.]